MDDIFNGLGVEIELPTPDSFRKIRETLQRIGYASNTENTLYQSCHILHKRGRYSIMHFKELFKLDGKSADFTENDLARRNTITRLLEDWNLLTVINRDDIEEPQASVNQIKVVKHADKDNWKLMTKYTIGRRETEYDD